MVFVFHIAVHIKPRPINESSTLSHLIYMECITYEKRSIYVYPMIVLTVTGSGALYS